jgi:hypothetical protein
MHVFPKNIIGALPLKNSAMIAPDATPTGPTHWIVRIGDGENFEKGSPHNTWGLSTNSCGVICMRKKAVARDVLWFVKTGARKAFAMSMFVCTRNRNADEPDALVYPDISAEDLKWNDDTRYDTYLEYANLYIVDGFRFQTPDKDLSADTTANVIPVPWIWTLSLRT